MIQISEDDLASQLAEGIHTAFRKATDCPQALPIHRLISEMPDGEWGQVIRWTVSGIALNFTAGEDES